MPVAALEQFDVCNYSESENIFLNHPVKSKDRGMILQGALSASIHGKNYEKAVVHGVDLLELMWGHEGVLRGNLSLLSAESTRVYKGEPFEKAMAAIYTGIAFFNLGDYDNARAAFTKAQLASLQYQKNPEIRLTIADILLAVTYAQLGEFDNAVIGLNQAKTRYPQNTFLSEGLLDPNQDIILIESGSAPQKIRAGAGNSQTDWVPRSDAWENITFLTKDGQEYQALEIEDLWVQATNKSRTARDKIQGVKGTLDEVATITAIVAANEAVNNPHAKNREAGLWISLGAGLFALANQSQADLRQWTQLPGKIYLFLPDDAYRKVNVAEETKLSENGSHMKSHSKGFKKSRQIMLLRNAKCG